MSNIYNHAPALDGLLNLHSTLAKTLVSLKFGSVELSRSGGFIYPALIRIQFSGIRIRLSESEWRMLHHIIQTREQKNGAARVLKLTHGRHGDGSLTLRVMLHDAKT